MLFGRLTCDNFSCVERVAATEMIVALSLSFLFLGPNKIIKLDFNFIILSINIEYLFIKLNFILI